MRGKGFVTFLILVVIGGILGGLGGVALNLTLSGTRVVKYLTTQFNVGIEPPWQMTLNVLHLTFGFKLKLSPIIVLGMAIGGLFSRKF
ncbi:MAG: DUF4321 domain-containing protein [bacterium]|nr:DUF4321 domain-containing protein [bacterium]